MILIADDSSIIREKLVELLSSEPGIDNLELAKDGSEAIEKINLLKPEIVIIDLSMPKVSGFEVLKFVNETFPKTKSIILTNHSSEPFRKKAVEIGCYSFHDKYSDFEQVVNEVVNLRKADLSGDVVQ
jgi:DNA-binding NarL/FixJ family response regulator